MVWVLLGWDVAVRCFICEGFAETALESLGFLLFFYPQPVSLSSSFPSFHTGSPFHWLLCSWGSISREEKTLRNIIFYFNLISTEIFYNILCLEVDSWQWCGRDFLKCWDCVKGREVKWGEENSWLLFLSWFRNYWPLLSIFFHVPKLGADGKAALCLPECSQCIQFPVQRARARKTKTDGFWRKREVGGPEVRAWRAQMGNGGEIGGGGWGEEMDDTHGSCY